ncbi:MAG TPA: NAD+ synthase [Armatimonadota bacterium]|nr:NAD+ synthase [Armatimonadota bacterium]
MAQPVDMPLRVAIAQINMAVGDLDGNTDKIIDRIGRAREMAADIVIFPELAITGCPPEDLLLKNGFVRRNIECLHRITGAAKDITAVVGFVDLDGDDLFNAAAVVSGGKLMGVHHKVHLPNYGVFDEERYFRPGRGTHVYELDEVVFGVEICEDSWYAEGPHKLQALLGDAQVIIVINSSPFHAGKWRFREEMLATRASDNSCFFVYGNLVGGQDELVFDGHSMVFGPDGRLICRGPALEEALVLADLDVNEVLHRRLAEARRREEKEQALAGPPPGQVERIQVPPIPRVTPRPELPPCLLEAPGRLDEIYKALMLGTRDYVDKNGFQRVVLGLSGGIDSALTAVIAADALGPERVVAVVMPSEFSSPETQSDAVKLAEALGIQRHWIPIREVFEAYKATLADAFAGRPPDVAEENLQARTRGNILMALSNKFGWLVLTTGNKSELAVGYTTLYGDMAGGFGILKDVPKTMVYELANYRNSLGRIIPESIIRRAPSAELRPGQKDVDTLPPYEILDPIIHAYVEEDKSVAEIVEMGFDEEVVRRVVRMSDRNEYKRRQSPPGIKITPKAFGKDRRLPITNKYRE